MRQIDYAALTALTLGLACPALVAVFGMQFLSVGLTAIVIAVLSTRT